MSEKVSWLAGLLVDEHRRRSELRSTAALTPCCRFSARNSPFGRIPGKERLGSRVDAAHRNSGKVRLQSKLEFVPQCAEDTLVGEGVGHIGIGALVGRKRGEQSRDGLAGKRKLSEFRPKLQF